MPSADLIFIQDWESFLFIYFLMISFNEMSSPPIFNTHPSFLKLSLISVYRVEITVLVGLALDTSN